MTPRFPSLRRSENGFTLVELLTVIIIIGILAAIAIPLFSAQKARAADSNTLSDVRNMATAVESYLADPKVSVDTISDATVPVRTSPYVTYSIKGNTTTNGYCIAAFNTRGKVYNSAAKQLTYDSTGGGLGKSSSSCAGTDSLGAPNTPTAVTGGNATGVGSASAFPATATISYSCTTGALVGTNCNIPDTSYPATSNTGTQANTGYTSVAHSGTQTVYDPCGYIAMVWDVQQQRSIPTCQYGYVTRPYTYYTNEPYTYYTNYTYYTCPNGGSLNGTTCGLPASTAPATATTNYSCPAGYTLTSKICSKIETS